MSLILIIKLASLFVLLWFGTVLGLQMARNESIHVGNFMIPAAAAVTFAWSMGWLS